MGFYLVYSGPTSNISQNRSNLKQNKITNLFFLDWQYSKPDKAELQKIW